MKILPRILSLLLSIIFITSAFSACSVSKLDENSSDSDQSSDKDSDNALNGAESSDNSSAAPLNPDGTPKETEPLPSNAYSLFESGAYTVKLVMPDNPTDTEKAVYTKLRASLKSKTGVTVESNTDYLKSGETHSSSERSILVGFTNYNESQKAYTTTENGTYGVKFYNNKIAFYFSTKDEGLSLVDAFCSAIKSNSDKAFWISNTFSVAKKTAFKLESIPAYPTATTAYDCEGDTTMLLAKSTNLDTFKSYCTTLKSNGFTEYSKRDNVNGNYFRTFTKGTMALTVYFTASSKTVRIISGPLSDIPTKDVDRTPESNKTPSVTLLTQGAERGSGLGIIYHLPNGKFFVYDGGYSDIYAELKKLAKSNDITIAAWVISHPHPDHEEAFDKFLKDHSDDVRIENVMYNFVNCSDKYGTSETIKPFVEKYLDRTTNVIKPHSGQIYNFGSSSIEILQTPEDFIPNNISDVNYSTMVVRFTVEGQTMIALGDAYDGATDILLANYGSHLKSDMVQLAHHGSWPGTVALYEKINASTVLWPSCASNAKKRYNASDHASLRKAISLAKDVYLAGEGTATLNLPYSAQNNKPAFLERLGLS